MGNASLLPILHHAKYLTAIFQVLCGQTLTSLYKPRDDAFVR
jgi:hypothetical protein